MRRLAGLIVVLGLGACTGARVPIIDVDSIGVPKIAVFERMPPGAEILGRERATSCKNKLWSPASSRENALAQLKVRADRLGGNALFDVIYMEGGTSLATNCWSTVTAYGVVLRVRSEVSQRPDGPVRGVTPSPQKKPGATRKPGATFPSRSDEKTDRLDEIACDLVRERNGHGQASGECSFPRRP